MAQDTNNATDGVDVNETRRNIVSTLARAVLHGIVSPVPVAESFEESVSGNVQFKVGNALVTIFNDVGEFDYFDEVVLNGERFDFSDGIDDWIWDEIKDSDDRELLQEIFIRASK